MPSGKVVGHEMLPTLCSSEAVNECGGCEIYDSSTDFRQQYWFRLWVVPGNRLRLSTQRAKAGRFEFKYWITLNSLYFVITKCEENLSQNSSWCLVCSF